MVMNLSNSPANDQTMKPAVIQIAPGNDVLETIVRFSFCRRATLTIISCSGTVDIATLHSTLSPTSRSIFQGPFTVLNLTGIINSPPLPLPRPHYSSGITLVNTMGQVFGGLIAGKVVAGGNGVTVMTTLFKIPGRAFGVDDEEADSSEDDTDEYDSDEDDSDEEDSDNEDMDEEENEEDDMVVDDNE